MEEKIRRWHNQKVFDARTVTSRTGPTRQPSDACSDNLAGGSPPTNDGNRHTLCGSSSRSRNEYIHC